MPPNDYPTCQDSATNEGFSNVPGAGSGILPCGLPVSEPNDKPCYVESFEFTVDGGHQSVKYTFDNRNDPSLTVADHRKLQDADLLLEVVSDVSSSSQGGKPTKVWIVGVTTPTCPDNAHSYLRFVPQGNVARTEWKGASKCFEVTALPTAHYGDSLFDRYWPFGAKGKRVYDVSVESCGVPLDASQSAPGVVKGRIEAYRKSDYKLTISLPALKGRKGHKSKSFDLKTRTTTSKSSSSSSSNFGRNQEGRSTEFQQSAYNGTDTYKYTTTRNIGKGLVKTEAVTGGTKDFGDDASATSTSYQTSSSLIHQKKYEFTGPEDDLKLETQDVHPTGVTFTANGESIDAVRFLGVVLDLPNKMSKFMEDLKNSVPKIGWQADLSVAVIQGQFELGWKLVPNAKADHAQIWTVGRSLDFKINCDLVKIEVSIGFGIDWTVANPLWDPPLVEVAIVVKIGVVATANLNFTLASNSPKPFEAIAELKSVPSITATAKAMVNGVGVKAECKIETGLKGSFTFTGSFEKDPSLIGEIGFLPIVMTAELVAFKKKVNQKLFEYPKKVTPIFKADLLTAKSKGG